MKNVSRMLVSLFALGVLSACERQDGAVPEADGEPGQAATPVTAADPATRPASRPVKTLVAMNIRGARMAPVVSGMKHPWAFEFIDDRRVIVTELGGRMLLADLEGGETVALSGVPAVATGHEQTGLLDVALHPDFERNGRLYISYTVADEASGAYFLTAVSTAVLEGNRLVDERRILTAEPPGWSPSNFGGALAFDDQGFLYVSVGDRSSRDTAQDGQQLRGKILRLTDEGAVPPDNPFVDDPGVDDRVFALGVRNPQGLHFDGPSGLLYEAEHGPMGGDEVNVIRAGVNYGWPLVTYGQNYTEAAIGAGTHAEGLAQPLFYFTPSTAISPLVVYRGAMFPEWDGDVLVGALKGKHVMRLDVDDGVVRSAYPFLGELNARVRDLKVGSDGALYVLIQFGSLYRVWRDATPEVVTDAPRGEHLYALVCAGCHDTGAAGAPMLDDRERWSAIASQPRAVIDRHVIEGLGDMPERGLCYLCTDEQLGEIVDYMLQAAGAGIEAAGAGTEAAGAGD